MRDRPVSIWLIDPDPVFRLGLKIWLDQFADLRVLADLDTGTTALAQWATLTATAQPQLVIINLQPAAFESTAMAGLSLCQQLKALTPAPRVLILGDRQEPVIQAAAQQAQADGYALRSQPASELAQIIRQVAHGQSVWLDWSTPAPTVAAPPSATPSAPPPATATPIPPRSGRSRAWRRALQRYIARTGLPQITTEIERLRAQRSQLTLFEQIIVDGQLRELRAALWIVEHLAQTHRQEASTPTEQDLPPEPVPAEEPEPLLQPDAAVARLRPRVTAAAIAPLTNLEADLPPLMTLTVDAAFTRLQGNLRNLTDVPLEIDVLRGDRKRELLYLALRQWVTTLAELRQSQVTPGYLYDHRDELLQQMWRAITTDFFGPYYRVAVGPVDQELVPLLQAAATTVQAEILQQIPLLPDLLAHWLFESPLMVEGRPQAIGSPAALQQAEMILDHALIQLANAVMQPLLNQFADVEAIKRDFYDRRLLSTREIERYRNDLSWRYRTERWLHEPTAIFESQHRLFTLTATGIIQQRIYAPRRDELSQLTGIPYWVTLALETRDAIAPRFRSLVRWVGTGVIYVLTDVIGRSIGLIGRGILQGIGSAWQDRRFSRNGERSR